MNDAELRESRASGAADAVDRYLWIYKEDGYLSKVQLKDLKEYLDLLNVFNKYRGIYAEGLELYEKLSRSKKSRK